jgi:exopolyphosphatase/guanosine-5'-triphosphate,3'-diphosphate pyrophosphatase
VTGTRRACIDIGSNTTALLVAELEGGELTVQASEREFTLLGDVLAGGHINAESAAQICATVDRFVKHAAAHDCGETDIVATHALREAGEGPRLAAMIERACGHPVRILGSAEEARYSFAGATGSFAQPAAPTIVVDSGGGSTEFVWSTAEGLRSRSFPIGSSWVAREYLTEDPPSQPHLRAAWDATARALDDFEPPAAEVALVVGGGATTARELTGGLIDAGSVDRALKTVASMPAAQLAEKLGLELRRAHLLPSSLTLLGAISAKLGLPLEVGRGGLREGVLLDAV